MTQPVTNTNNTVYTVEFPKALTNKELAQRIAAVVLAALAVTALAIGGTIVLGLSAPITVAGAAVAIIAIALFILKDRRQPIIIKTQASKTKVGSESILQKYQAARGDVNKLVVLANELGLEITKWADTHTQLTMKKDIHSKARGYREEHLLEVMRLEKEIVKHERKLADKIKKHIAEVKS